MPITLPRTPTAPNLPPPLAPPAAPRRVADAIVTGLASLGVRHAFGVGGGAAARLLDALAKGPVRFTHFRHESGAAFAAAEAYFATGRPAAVLTTTGPGLTNALTGVAAARWEGAKLVLISAGTPPALRGRWACQETSGTTVPLDGLFTPGPLFHHATMMESPAELGTVVARLAAGLARPGGFVAHVSIPTDLQGAAAELPRGVVISSAPGCPAEDVAVYARMLAAAPFVVWAGFGAREAAPELRALAERTGARVMCSPRGKGVFPERHPLSLGVTGLGGYGEVESYLAANRPAYTLVLGTRLGEPTSYWLPLFVPERAFIHVDVDPTVPGAAYPEATTYGVQSDVRAFLAGVLHAWPAAEVRGEPPVEAPETPSHAPPRRSLVRLRDAAEDPADPTPGGAVRAAALMQAIQRVIVDGSDAVVMTESGNAFAWGNHLLRFDEPGRYRVSVGFGSMGHFTAGVVGAALARGGKAVAVVGDGSMLMNGEVNTAVAAGARAVWVVLNDGGYGMVEHGMRALGFTPPDTSIPRVDFVMMARAVGADGARVEREEELDAALEAAMAAAGPFVVDVGVDPSEAGPWMERIRALIAQGAKGPGGGGS